MRTVITLLFAFPPVRWLCAAARRHTEQELRGMFWGEQYRWRYTVFGSPARWADPLALDAVIDERIRLADLRRGSGWNKL